MNSSIEILPVELLHRIFDNLDAETIVCSIRLVSRLFRSVVKIYDRYNLNLKLISKRNFYILCRLINPQYVISLTLSNDNQILDQIDLFISLVHLEQFTQIQSLTLLNIDELQFNFILKHIHFNKLTSFSFNIRQYNDACIETTANLLSSIIAIPNFHKLNFTDIGHLRISKISWPINNSIQYLKINHFIDIHKFCIIFQYSSHLHRYIINNDNNIDRIIPEFSFRTSLQELTHLIIERLNIDINILKSLLLITPSLIYFKFIGQNQLLDGYQWEEFIKKNLSQLNKFEFYFNIWKSTDQTLLDLKMLIISFQTPFWIEDKKWFVNCEYDSKHPNNILLYSLPICISSLDYTSKLRRISFSTHPLIMNNDLSMMNNITVLNLDLNKALFDNIQDKEAIIKQPIFPNVTILNLELSNDWPLLVSLPFSIIIDFSRIVCIKIWRFDWNEYYQNKWREIINFMEQAYNLSSLIICYNLNKYKLDQPLTYIYSNLPHHIKYLKITINDLDQIQMILEQCENLSLIEFNIEDRQLSKKVINWFVDNTIDTICKQNGTMVIVWLGEKKISINKNN